MSVDLGLSPALLLEIYAHAKASYPDECCGLLTGPAAGGVTAARRCVNRQNELHAKDPVGFRRDARTAYNFGLEDLRFLDRSIGKDAEVVTRLVYHSHADVGAYFSAEDKRAALHEGAPLYPVDYLVIDVRLNGPQGARVYRWKAERRDFIEIASYDAMGRPSHGQGD